MNNDKMYINIIINIIKPGTKIRLLGQPDYPNRDPRYTGIITGYESSTGKYIITPITAVQEWWLKGPGLFEVISEFNKDELLYSVNIEGIYRQISAAS
jgi:hypothetical protein